MATSTFAAKITDLVGGTIDDDACDDWMTEGAKEIINQLPARLKEKCMTATGVGTDSVVDLDGLGEILYVTRKNADSGYYTECRKIPSSHGGLATDSTDLNYYATATDPVYWVDGDTSGAATLYVKPTPTANQPAILHHIGYPTVNNGTDNVIANFPDEAEPLVVLYAAIRQLLQYQSTMSASFNSDIGTAFTATNTELDETQVICDLINTQADSAVTALGNMATEIALANAEVDLANPEVDLAKAEILETVTLIDGGIDTAVAAVKTSADLVGAEVVLANAEVDLEDMEKASGYIQTAQGFLAEASGYVNEVNARVAQVNGQIAVANGYLATASGYNQTGQAYLGTASSYGNQASGFLNAAAGFASELGQKIAIANGYIAEANARLQADNAKYQWYGDQYTKLSAEYARGLTALKGGGAE